MFLAKKLQHFLIACFFLLSASTFLSCVAEHEIRILHMNDFHGFAMPYKPYGSDEAQGGLAYLASRAENLRAEKPTLFLAAGDMIQGNNWANLFQGKSSIEAMNVMGFDAMVVGNHEFDFGQAVLRERIGEANFPILGANVVGLNELKPYIVKNMDGITVAVIGVVTDDTPVTTHPKNVKGLKFLSTEETIKKYIQELRKKSDIIVILSHAGFSADTELARKVDGADIIVGGHSHTKVAKPVLINKSFVVQAFEHGKTLGVVDITLKYGKVVDVSGYLEPIKPTGKQNKAVEAIVTKYQQKVDIVMNETVGEALVDLDGVNVRLQETNLGNLITDIMRRTTGADAAIINGGTIRTSIKKGLVKVSDVYAVVPFDNYIVAIKLTGQQIRDTLEHGVTGVEDEEGRFPQISGLTFTYDIKGKKGSRVKDIFIGGIPLAAEKEYTVATNDFLAAGGDGYKAFGDSVKSSRDYAVIGGAMRGEKLVYIDSGRWLRDVVIDYIKTHKVISPEIEGRIKEIKG
ncbi:MAG: bifunctional metallophosphatase/5'-nucleotidase [Syntrophorhabdus sp.]|nr:bifunctional metallophosphatase/5'-nucleotidase [Syntrophorhabdus sp.]